MSQYVPVTIAAGYDGRVTKKGLREALRANPAGITFKVESHFHGPGDRITGHNAVRNDWTLEVHVNGASVAHVAFDANGEAPNHLQAVVY